ncbi:Polymer-forming cytoskeletal protein [Nocardia ninae]|uniref:Polymer-forming cytoskeletal protein n=1 Tax=Nocardia ninae NBRC 108245 TaxID=1210091 RepID=A0A511MNA9_9NOCA|nr:hypothetical protein [Nocardia ninae]GEM41931.1 hypothetical protein NN4_64500 [Nocardia ninae NBRC 108245]
MTYFELTEESRRGYSAGKALRRIRATEDLPRHGVAAGTLGGWVEHINNVTGAAWVGGDATVFGEAVVTDSATVLDNATVSEGAKVSGQARIGGYASVSGRAAVGESAEVDQYARIEGDARVFGAARIRGDVVITDSARVGGQAEIDYDAMVSGHALVAGLAYVSGAARIYGRMKIDHDAYIVDPQDLFEVGPIGSECAGVTLFRTRTGHVLHVGCWTGTIDELAAEVSKRTDGWYHGNAHEHARWKAEYAALESLCRVRVSGWKPVQS